MGSDSPFHLPETGRNWLFPYTRCWDWPKAPFILCNHHRPSIMSVLLSIFKRLRKQGPKWFSSFLLSTVAQSLHLVSLSCVIPLYLERWMLVVGFYPEPFQHAPKSVLKSRAIMECYNSLSLIFYYIHLLIHSSGKGAHSTAHCAEVTGQLAWLWDLILLLPCGSWGTQFLRLGGKYLHQLSHLTGLKTFLCRMKSSKNNEDCQIKSSEIKFTWQGILLLFLQTTENQMLG